jgi:DNA-binding transcriptional LysR family regulator
MSLSSIQLDAFWALSKTGNFSKAAESIHITQSALSQRIINLEESVGTTLVIRDSNGIRLTDTGQELLRYIQKKQALEEEFQTRVGMDGAATSEKLSGRIRIASLSSLMHSVLFPALSQILKVQPDVMVDTSISEIRELENRLRQGQVDFVVTHSEWKKEGLKGYKLGEEENVLVRSKLNKERENIFLDHDPQDSTTEDFMRLNGQKSRAFRRCYVDDIYGILEGVSLGWGSAIVPKHLIDSNPKYQDTIKVAKGYTPLKTPIWLYHYEQPYYTRLEHVVIDSLTENVSKVLEG